MDQESYLCPYFLSKSDLRYLSVEFESGNEENGLGQCVWSDRFAPIPFSFRKGRLHSELADTTFNF